MGKKLINIPRINPPARVDPARSPLAVGTEIPDYKFTPSAPISSRGWGSRVDGNTDDNQNIQQPKDQNLWKPGDQNFNP